MAIIKELQKVAPFGWIENRQPPVVEDEELNATDGFEQAAIAAIASSEGKRLEEARDADRAHPGETCRLSMVLAPLATIVSSAGVEQAFGKAS
jgi:hypothetical protein